MQLINWDLGPKGITDLSAENLACSTYELSSVKAFLGQVPAEPSHRSHTAYKAFSHLLRIVSVFQRKKTFMASSTIFTRWLTCLSGLYFPVSASSASPTVSAAFFKCYLVHSLLSAPHPSLSQAKTILWLFPEDHLILFRSWLLHRFPGLGTSWTRASRTTDRTWAASGHSWDRPRIPQAALTGPFSVGRSPKDSRRLHEHPFSSHQLLSPLPSILSTSPLGHESWLLSKLLPTSLLRNQACLSWLACHIGSHWIWLLAQTKGKLAMSLWRLNMKQLDIPPRAIPQSSQFCHIDSRNLLLLPSQA